MGGANVACDDSSDAVHAISVIIAGNPERKPPRPLTFQPIPYTCAWKSRQVFFAGLVPIIIAGCYAANYSRRVQKGLQCLRPVINVPKCKSQIIHK
jgi:hypothetical protein